MNSGLSPGQAARTHSATSRAKRMRLSFSTAVVIVAQVGDRRKELVHQIAVRAMDFD